MKKNLTAANLVDYADKIKTLTDEHFIGLLAFSREEAVFYQKYPERPPSVFHNGQTQEFNAINKSSTISIARCAFNDYVVLITAPNEADAVFHSSEVGNAKGVVIFHAKPESGKIHVCLICNRSSTECCTPFKIENPSDVWVFKSMIEPLFINNGFRFNWHKLYEIVWGHPIIVKRIDDMELCKNEECS